ncbi:unnamed protein product [Peronospora farinosa]|uniref:C2H2-type domain-containing protein n=1 Tax=Peronospora farinosa TaxID=134698 RepID=A0AAV0SQL9_9STRA|nr:unnamed protein product [Peronospora farinosa]CAI5705363.1 unnamed protein product [Peronospora farinosa]
MMSLLAHSLSTNIMDSDVYEGIATQTPTAMDRPFECKEPGCGRRFNRKFTLSEHKKTHTGEKPFVCPLVECSRRFSTSGNLARHKRLHASLKPFECDINGCRRSFPSQEKLDHHIKIHTGRRTHVCHVSGCTKTFSTAGNLTRHIKNSHPELIRNNIPSYQYAQTSLEHQLVLSPQTLPITPVEHLHTSSSHMIPAAGPLTKLEQVAPPVFSPDSVELSPFHDELSVFQMTCEFPMQPFISRPHDMNPFMESAVVDITRCSMSVLDEVIEFELTKNI